MGRFWARSFVLTAVRLYEGGSGGERGLRLTSGERYTTTIRKMEISTNDKKRIHLNMQHIFQISNGWWSWVRNKKLRNKTKSCLRQQENDGEHHLYVLCPVTFYAVIAVIVCVNHYVHVLLLATMAVIF